MKGGVIGAREVEGKPLAMSTPVAPQSLPLNIGAGCVIHPMYTIRAKASLK